MDAEKMKAHILHLQEQHDSLDKKIEEDYAHYQDDARVKELKRQKLRLRDKIEQCKLSVAKFEGRVLK
jgi:hypothetical protein